MQIFKFVSTQCGNRDLHEYKFSLRLIKDSQNIKKVSRQPPILSKDLYCHILKWKTSLIHYYFVVPLIMKDQPETRLVGGSEDYL